MDKLNRKKKDFGTKKGPFFKSWKPKICLNFSNPKNASTELVYEMIGIDIPELVAINAINSEEKWEARKDRRRPELIPKTERPNYLRGIPNDWCQILKQQFSICPICKNNIRSEFHMSAAHNIDLYSC